MPKKEESILQGSTTVGERGQIVIPQNIRKALGIKAGETMTVLMQDNLIVVLPSKEVQGIFKRVLGSLKKLRR